MIFSDINLTIPSQGRGVIEIGVTFKCLPGYFFLQDVWLKNIEYRWVEPLLIEIMEVKKSSPPRFRIQ